jgi:hypothetical protein
MFERGEEAAVENGVAADAKKAVETEPAGHDAVGDSPAELAFQNGLAAVEVPLFSEAGEAPELPFLAPTGEVEGAVGLGDFFRQDDGHDCAGVHPDRAAHGLDAEAKIDIFRNAGDGGIEEIGATLEEFHSHEEGVHFDVAGKEWSVAVEFTAAFALVVCDDQESAGGGFVDAGLAAGHVDFFGASDAFAVEGCGGGSVFLGGGFEEEVEPAGLEEDIIVRERGEGCVNVRQGELFGLVRGKEAVRADVDKARPLLRGEEIAAFGRGATIDANDWNGFANRLKEGQEAFAGEVEPLALRNDNCGGWDHDRS